MKGILFILFLLIFCTIQSQKNLEIIQHYLSNQIDDESIRKQDFKDLLITDESYSRQIEADHIYVNQTFEGIEILNSGGIFVVKNNAVVYSSIQLITDVQNKINTRQFNISAQDAIAFALREIGITSTLKHKIIEQKGYSLIFEKGDVSLENIPVDLVYVPTNSDTFPIHLAWELSIYEKSQKHWWSIQVDAINGDILKINDWVVECTFEDTDHKNHHHQTNAKRQPRSKTALPPPTDAYNVFAIPLESPNHGNRSIISGTENLSASPFGWHDDDGNAGADYTITRGNNVFAYEDQDDNNNPGYSPDGGALLNFDFPLNLNNAPNTNLDPVITNLFYMNNIMHDIWYQYGFDEASGNFQENNYGNGGNGSDYVNAEAQDGGGTNNANFATPGDGANPRMQMYLWSAPTADNDLLEINSPSNLAGAYQAVQAGFGPSVPTTPITADFALVDDDSGDNEDACETLTNAATLNGKIVVIRRGTCTFISKVEAAEAAGALAVIMVNNVAGAPITMGGADPGIGIPSVMVSQTDGEALIDALLAATTLNGTLQSSGNLVQLDGDFDNGIIAHEYGHGISTRLTGGASNSNCLSNEEQMGEGWSDWFGLMLTIESGDIGTDIRGIGTYAIGEPTNGNGIRPAPYSTDLSVNNYTYDASNNAGAISQPHGVGFVWCTMLWDLSWALIDDYGYDADLYNGTGGNNIAMALVIEGLKLQPCNPGFVDGRDAILQADQMLYGGAHQCLIWQVFAARGLGYSADQGSSNSRTDQTEAFDLPPACQAPTVAPAASFSYNTDCSGEVAFTDLSTNTPDSWSWNFGDGNTSSLENPTHIYSSSGTYNVELVSSNVIGSGSNSITVTISLPDAPIVSDASICQNESVTFSGIGTGVLNWYDDSGTTLLESGNTFLTPNLSNTTNYLVQNVIEQAPQYVGPQNGSVGTGGFHNQTAIFALNFDALTSFSLVSVWINANTTGNRTINLYDAVDGGGNVIDQVTVNITNTGPQRITLNLDVPTVGSYSLGGVSMDLFRNNGGVNYPYSITNVVSIVSSSVGTDYYYYFYDWEIQTSPCLSPFTNIIAMVNPFTQSTDTQVSCGSFTWIDGNTYSSSNGNATYTLQSSAGCDSIVTLDLTVNNPTFSTDVETACDSYTWIDGTTYTSNNNTATYTLQNTQGCDSTITLNLNLSNSSYYTDVKNSCGPYTWIDGNIYTSSNNSATYTIQNTQGCDSTITLNLTVSNTSSGTDVQAACNSYTWIDGNTYTSSNNTATYNIVGGGANGCDSLVSLDLTINNTITGTDVQFACGSYTWIDGNTYTSSNNNATYTLVASQGCDSVVTLNLSIYTPDFVTDIQTTCDEFTWIDGNTYTSSNNTATFILQNANGCDSTISLDLTVNNVNSNILQLGPGTAQAEAANASYVWLDCADGFAVFPGENDQLFECQGTCYYEVAVLVTENGCSDTSECLILNVLEIDESINNQTISLYPNPASDVVYVNGLNSIEGIEKIELTDYNGRLIKSIFEISNTLDVRFLSDGVYFLNIIHNNGKEIFKIIIQ
ncbi:MAG: T9SS-dependent M36 family metallopeptidase [Crocinitomicaceae bacterium]|nr:T9SS-dependent M36 family metallopeptidase [Crocinitomicaceae bacterium]